MSDEGIRVRCIVRAYDNDDTISIISDEAELILDEDPPVDLDYGYQGNDNAWVGVQAPTSTNFTGQPFSVVFEIYVIEYLNETTVPVMVHGSGFGAGGANFAWLLRFNDDLAGDGILTIRTPQSTLTHTEPVPIGKTVLVTFGWDGTDAFLTYDGVTVTETTSYNVTDSHDQYRFLGQSPASARSGFQIRDIRITENNGAHQLRYFCNESSGLVAIEELQGEAWNGAINDEDIHQFWLDSDAGPPFWLEIDDVTIFSSEVLEGWTRDMNDYVVSESDLEGWTSTGAVDINQQGIAFPLTNNPGTYPTQQTVTNDAGTTQGNEWDLEILEDPHGNRESSLIMTITVEVADLNFTLPTRSGQSYNYYVLWGDDGAGDGLVADDSVQTHTYPAPGDYTIEISIHEDDVPGGGVFQAIQFNNDAINAPKLTSIDQWGYPGVTSLETGFFGCINATFTLEQPAQKWMLTNIGNGFRNCNTAIELDLNFLNISGCSNLVRTIQDCNNLETLDIQTWDTSNVSNYGFTFANNNVITTIHGIETLDTNSATAMNNMFQGSSIYSADLSAWNVGSLTNANVMWASSGLTDAHWNALLVGWEAQSPALQDNVTLVASAVSSGAGATAKANLESNHNWTIDET